MKKILLTITACIMSSFIFAQAPASFNFQAVARDAAGELIKEKSVSMRVSVLETTATGTSVYQETHTVSSDKYGLVNLTVGAGTVVSGTFSAIKWGGDKHFLKIEMDPAGGSAYKDMGTQQLVSVPYALHAETAKTVSNSDNDTMNEIQIISKSGNTVSLTKGGGSFMLGAADDDGDSMNEIQTISSDGTNLSLSKSGGSVALSGINFWNKSGNDLDYSAGKVSIGNTTPLGYFHVEGSNSATRTGYFKNTGSKSQVSIGGPGYSVSVDTGNLYVQGYSVMDGTVGLGARLEHTGDNNSYLEFGTDKLDMFLGGTQMMEANQDLNLIKFAPRYVHGGFGLTYGDTKFVVASDSFENNPYGFLSSNRINTNAANSYGGYFSHVAYGPYNNSSYGTYSFGGDNRTGTSPTAFRVSYGAYNFAAMSDTTNGVGWAYGLFCSTYGKSNRQVGGYFVGNTFVTGGYFTTSDENLKSNVVDLGTSLNRIMSLPVKSYTFKNDEYAHMNLPSGRQTGIMAQDLQKTYPELVTETVQPALSEQEQKTITENGGTVPEAGKSPIEYKAVNYTGLVPHLVKAMQEQQELIEAQKVALELLQKQVQELQKKADESNTPKN